MNDTEKLNLKILLQNKAIEILHKRIETSSSAMQEAQLAANEEGKSSVGDKYETSRAMAQIDRDIHARQLENAQKELTFIQQVDVKLFSKAIQIGSCVITDDGTYFFLAGLGPVDVQNKKVLFLSINSPIGKIFSGKRSGDVVSFNGKNIGVQDVF